MVCLCARICVYAYEVCKPQCTYWKSERNFRYWSLTSSSFEMESLNVSCCTYQVSWLSSFQDSCLQPPLVVKCWDYRCLLLHYVGYPWEFVLRSSLLGIKCFTHWAISPAITSRIFSVHAKFCVQVVSPCSLFLLGVKGVGAPFENNTRTFLRSS